MVRLRIANLAKWAIAQFCRLHGFRFVNGRLVASRCPIPESGSCDLLADTLGDKRAPASSLWRAGSMHIVCPHCATSYAVNPASLGAAGRTVRCSRCKETWLARPEDAIEMAEAMPAAMPNSAQSAPPAANDAAAEWEALAHEEEGQDAPVVDSPAISAGWPA